MRAAILVTTCTLSLITITLFLFLYPIKTTAPSAQTTNSVVTEAVRNSSTTQEVQIANIYTLAQTNPTEAIANLKEFIKNEPSYMHQCHELAHEIGHTAYKYFDEEAFSFKDPFCGGGYLHGLLEEASIFDETMSLKEIVHTVCSGDIEESCLHGLGHAIYKSVQNIPDAITYCDRVRTKNKDCYDGVYMELFDAEEASEALLVEQALNICASGNLQTKASCLFYLPRVLKQTPPTEAVKLCTTLKEKDDQLVCALGSGVMFMKYAPVFELDVVTNDCTFYSDTSLKEACVTGVGNYFTYGNVTNTEW